ncbi:tRNA threonylcarbamoyladenosine biosynthesis protein TsaE [Kineococcus xinjiangensis]|uniref:tRNA threonylcarbamoyladenosine biosynthesis protein TsaE n=1 Tax=Kineococcus xinjiangensis TaxID=512762 RepID=A0A2S6ITT6_9ACTN|nr:tRNA (adenosine(37)-N6)-threonylcarbamoyltransferase complex ATPase subunit type 1 TsaE [Kineococcus xinjiangensis]PPK97581.1 tRNA threonylcarbamoyladenosine biosynthesis protein TsaE [Kineococcus xinjiangensis]
MSGDGDGTTCEVPTAEAMRDLGRRLAARVRAGDLLVLSGGLGAGKTTFVQGLADGLGVRGPITSPTFVIARVHPSLVGGPALVHADAYRVGSLGELEDLDLDASLDEAVTVVEWGAGLVEDLAEARLELHLHRRTGGAASPQDPHVEEAEVDEPRHVVLRAVGARWADVDLGAVAAAPSTAGGAR